MQSWEKRTEPSGMEGMGREPLTLRFQVQETVKLDATAKALFFYLQVNVIINLLNFYQSKMMFI